MNQKLTSHNYPFVPLTIHVRVSARKRLDLNTHALIDTGFSGDIVVLATEALKQETPGAYATWTMADGSEVLAPIFLGTIRFPGLEEDVGEVVGVTVTVLGDQPLIGQSILKHSPSPLTTGSRWSLSRSVTPLCPPASSRACASSSLG